LRRSRKTHLCLFGIFRGNTGILPQSICFTKIDNTGKIIDFISFRKIVQTLTRSPELFRKEMIPNNSIIVGVLILGHPNPPPISVGFWRKKRAIFKIIVTVIQHQFYKFHKIMTILHFNSKV